MVEFNQTYFSLDQICESGQCFRFGRLDGAKYWLIAGNRYLEARQTEDHVILWCAEEEFREFWRDYFDLTADYGEFMRRVKEEDAYLSAAAAFGSGIRILRQNLFETLITFIISQQNNIKRIRRCVELLCERYGELREWGNGVSFYAFPSAERLASAETADLMACNLGYRARYVRDTAQAVCAGKIDLEALKKLSYEQARAELMKLSGVGRKVADCICLFGLHRLDAFPEDTHILKVVERCYPDGFPYGEYAGCAGVMQQYLFYYDLKNKEA